MTQIGRLNIGRDSSPKVMGIINVSPESFYKGSVKTTKKQIAATALQMEKDGAHVIDIGAMSTAPYLDTLISEEQEASRLTAAIKVVKDSCGLAVSADTPRARVAKAAIAAGADVINDVTGLHYDKSMAQVVAESGASVIICAYSRSQATGAISGTVNALKESLRIARSASIDGDVIIIDPSIGFFRPEGKNPFFTKMTDLPWYARDTQMISGLGRLVAVLKKPVCISASRKSFIGYLLGLESPDDRLAPSIACEIISTMHGANLIRTHNVRETVQALTMFHLLSS